MKPTRRELATVAMAATLARRMEAQAPAPDIARLVHDANQRNSDTLTKFELPISTEPAFRFEA